MAKKSNGHGHGERAIVVRGAREHNLRNIDVRIPLGVFTCVTGVSGSGKSSLVAQTLYPALARELAPDPAREGDTRRNLGLSYERARRFDDAIRTYRDMSRDYADAPLLIVNAAEIDFAHNRQDYELLLEQIRGIRTGRHYFNPAQLAM